MLYVEKSCCGRTGAGSLLMQRNGPFRQAYVHRTHDHKYLGQPSLLYQLIYAPLRAGAALLNLQNRT